jgi:hypothetical protein
VSATPLKPPLAAGPPKPQKPPDAPKSKPPEPDVVLYTRSIAEKRPVELRLHDGTVVRGRITAFGQYTIAIVMETDIPIVVFKNFVATARAEGAR